MNHAAVRRFALLFAGISFSVLAATVLVVNSLNMIDPELIFGTTKQPNDQLPVFNAQYISLPYKIEGTTLALEALCTYSGPYYEDGTGREVSDVFAIRVHNTGTKMVLYGLIELHFENQTLMFEVTRIPPGTDVLIPEKNTSSFFTEMPSQCCGWTIDKSYLMRQDVEVIQRSDGGFLVTNKSEKDVIGFNIYHKSYRPEDDVYIGGIAHRTFISELKAGQSIIVEKGQNIPGNSIVFYE